MVVRIERTKKEKKKKESKIVAHISGLGFTNRLAVLLVMLLFAGLGGGFYLARLSIANSYTGALACWTAAFAPIGTAIGVVLARIVDKSKAENTGANGEGIVYAQAKAANFTTTADDTGSNESPAI